MPARQRGSVKKMARSYRACWSDENYKRRTKQGFRTKTEARRFLDREVTRVERIRLGEDPEPRAMPTVQELLDEFLQQHSAERNTIATLTYRLRYAAVAFGALPVNRLTVHDIALWRKRLPPGSAWHIHKALRQLLNYAVAVDYVPKNIARQVPNPEPKRPEVPVFESRDEVDAVAGELDPLYKGIPIFVCETGLRPEEWIGLERGDIEKARQKGPGVVHVRRVYTDGQVKPYGKQRGSLRTVFLTERAIEAIEDTPRRRETPLLFPGERGGHLDLHRWRSAHWNVAVAAAGLHRDEYGRPVRRTPYSLRHTYAAWMIAAGVDVYTIAKRMGTSVDQIDKTYGHLLTGSLEAERSAFEMWHQSRVPMGNSPSREPA